MYEFKIEIIREGRWWMVRIPEIDGLTQARRLAEAPIMAREYIALDRGLPFAEVKVEVASVRMEEPEFRELLDAARQVQYLRAQADEAERRATRMAREYASWLVAYGVPVRDVAALLGVSASRVSQLAAPVARDYALGE